MIFWFSVILKSAIRKKKSIICLQNLFSTYLMIAETISFGKLFKYTVFYKIRQVQ